MGGVKGGCQGQKLGQNNTTKACYAQDKMHDLGLNLRGIPR